MQRFTLAFIVRPFNTGFCPILQISISHSQLILKRLAPGGNTGNIIYDFFIGRELNPRIGPLDLKFFCELRPGLIGWVVLDWIMVYKAYQETGTFPANLLLVTVFQTIYVADALWFESAILTTMDITHDGFGFMLAFGDLAWVPFLYCLQPRFLYETKFVLPWYCLAPIALLNLVGYGIFRLSNSQKDRFRKDPKDPVFSGMEALPT
ncbi:Delta(14)-sterol reductase [Bulinus truncatus]|nr:Delta(14)-sterol reductase [Bulinus truncatus]